MKLIDWIKTNPDKYIEKLSTGAIAIFAKPEKNVDLWHLIDYFVSSVGSGPMIILCPNIVKSKIK